MLWANQSKMGKGREQRQEKITTDKWPLQGQSQSFKLNIPVLAPEVTFVKKGTI